MVARRWLRHLPTVVISSVVGLVVAPGVAVTRARVTVAVEAVFLVFVVAVTVFLTGASIH